MLEKFAKPKFIDTGFVTSFDPADIFTVDPKISTPPPPERPAQVAGAIDKMADRLAKLPNQIGTGIVAVYREEKPRQQSLKNETGKTLRNVAGLLIVRSGPDQSERWIPVNFPEWKAEPLVMPVAAADNPTQMRLLFEAELEGGGQAGFDQRLPNPPPPKKQ